MKQRYIILGTLIVLFFLMTSSQLNTLLGPGLTVPEPVGAFLNGNLPTVTPADGGGNVQWTTVPAFPNLTFNDPLVIISHPQEDRLFVASRQGYIEHFVNDPNVTTKEVFVDLTNDVGVVWDGGFLGMAFHPEFGTPNSPNRNYVYMYYTAKGNNGNYGPLDCENGCFSCENNANFFGSYLRLSRFEVFDGTLNLNTNSELRMINIRQYNGTHRGGGLVFGDDGFMYLTIGDQARYTTAQNLVSNFEGGVIRIDVDEQGGNISHPPRRKMGTHTGNNEEFTGVGYYVPNDNPWLDVNNGIFEEFISTGHRNPHRLSKDAVTGEFWVGEIGETSREEINKIVIGENCGWPIYEGNLYQNVGACNANNMNMGPGAYNPPVMDFIREEASAIIGGYVYRGSKFPSLYGKYICGDYVQKRIFAIEEDGNGGYTKDHFLDFDPGGLITFGVDQNNELYLGRQANNTTLYTLGIVGNPQYAPTLLSEIGAFSDLNNLTPSPGLVPYDMIEPFWSDGASKSRWIAVPNNGTHNTNAEQIQFSENGNWNFPIGTVMIKHFELGNKRLETRFEVKGEDGNFYYLTYKWNDAQTDAELLSFGLDEEINVNGQTQIWHYPSPSECKNCHLTEVGSVLGVQTKHLNTNITYPSSGINANQLVTMSHLGMIDENITDANVNNYIALAAKDDSSRSLEDRARSYIDVNCSHCHQPATTNRAQFDARYTTPLPDQAMINGSVIDNLGINGARLIRPKVPALSLIHERANTLQDGIAMPPVAKNVIDQAGVDVIREWILSLEESDEVFLITHGAANQLDGGCYEITSEQESQVGAAWYPDRVNFSEDFHICLSFNFGLNEIGGSGMALVFHNQGTGITQEGVTGYFLGAANLEPSLTIEFDTYQSGVPNDIGGDHLSIWKDGDVNDYLTNQVCMVPNCENVEDGLVHNAMINWVSQSQTLEVTFDDELRLTYTGDVVQEIFGGDPLVNVGITGSTGPSPAINQQTLCSFVVESACLGQPCDDGDPNTINDEYLIDCTCQGIPDDAVDSKIYAKVFLEGFFNGNNGLTKNTDHATLIPNNQPFNTAPWNYNGTESANSIPTNTVDWILLVTRDANGNIIEQKAGFISTTGEIMDTDGSMGISVNNASTHFSIHHKSHLAVMSSSAYTSGTYDFTNSINQAIGTGQMVQQSGKYMMYSGDYDCNGIINNVDYNKWKTNSATLNQYLNVDGDGNGIINNLDYNLWTRNRSKIGHPPLQY